MLGRRALMASAAALAGGCGPFGSSMTVPSRPQATALTWHTLGLPDLLDLGGSLEGHKQRIQEIVVALEEDGENPNGPARGSYTLTARIPEYPEEFSESTSFSFDELAEWLGGLEADLFSVDSWTARILGERGVILPLDRFIANDEPKFSQEFYPYALDQFREDGKLYALPINVDPQLLHYDAAYFAEQGVRPVDESWDWDDLVESAERLTRRGEDGTVTRWGLMPQLNGLWWALWQNEAELADPITGRCRLQDATAGEALQFCRDLLHEHRVAPPVGGNDVWSIFSAPDILSTPRDSLPAMIFSRHNVSPRPAYRWAALPRGRVRSVPVAAGMGLAIAAQTEHTEKAYTALKGLLQTLQRFVAVPAQKEAVARLGEIHPSLLPEEVTAVQRSLEHGRAIPEDLQAWAAMHDIVDGLARGDEVSAVVTSACTTLERAVLR
ncbi:MAG: extracellular solute-binding protein [Chloroflexota bacterium]|nr:extracellular solute-binding protein [Chloroflexota bacterium]MDE2839922.1 extracellular solute-binding protein [Chloroflexota bacterium]